MDNSIDRVCNIDLDGEYLRILEPNTKKKKIMTILNASVVVISLKIMVDIMIDISCV